MSWRREDGPVGASARVEEGRLVLDKASPEDAGVYVCEAANEGGSVSSSALLRVLDAPAFLQKPQDIRAMQGERVELRCALSPNDASPPLLLWRLPGAPRQLLKEGVYEEGRVVVRQDRLVVRNASVGIDAGVYECVGVGLGGAVAARAAVVVVASLPPPIIGLRPRDLVLPAASTAVFPCEAVSDAEEAVVTWWFLPKGGAPSHHASPGNAGAFLRMARRVVRIPFSSLFSLQVLARP